MSETKQISRAEHLQWCKDRAMEYVNKGDYLNAIASMTSDLGKHPETAGSVETAVMLSPLVMMNPSHREAERFVLGFN